MVKFSCTYGSLLSDNIEKKNQQNIYIEIEYRYAKKLLIIASSNKDYTSSSWSPVFNIVHEPVHVVPPLVNQTT